MGIHIVVCVKQTPASGAIQLDPATGVLKTQGASMAVNPFDEYAVEEAVSLKEKLPGSTVSVLTLGQANADEVLREAIARGADQGFHICSPAFDGSDTLAVSYALAKGIEKIAKDKGPVHLVINGKQTNDGDTGQVGPGVAAWLDWPNVAFVRKVESVDDKKIVVHRMMEDGVDVLEMELPAAIAVVKEINTPRVASLKGKMAAKKAVIAKWTEADLGCAPAAIGSAGSPTRVVKTFSPPARPAGQTIDGATAADKAKKLVDKLQEMKLI